MNTYRVTIELIVTASERPDVEDFELSVGPTGPDIDLHIETDQWDIESVKEVGL